MQNQTKRCIFGTDVGNIKEYKITEPKLTTLHEPPMAYGKTSHENKDAPLTYYKNEALLKDMNFKDAVKSYPILLQLVNEGVSFKMFSYVADLMPFSFEDWADLMHISSRTLLRYRKDKKRFEPIHSEKILELYKLYQKGLEVFGDKEKLNTWLKTPNYALGNIAPTALMDNSFGIQMITEELIRIEHGIFA